MDEHCYVIAGAWSSSDDGSWNFVLDKQKMSRIVVIRDGTTIEAMKKAVLKEFFCEDVLGVSVSLSYWPPNGKELATGVCTPPVLLTNDISFGLFTKLLRSNSSLSLFASFETVVDKRGASEVDDNGVGFTTPLPAKKLCLSEGGSALRSTGFGCLSSAASKTQTFSPSVPDFLGKGADFRCSPVGTGKTQTLKKNESVPSKQAGFSFGECSSGSGNLFNGGSFSLGLDDADFLEAIAKEEELLKNVSTRTKDSVVSDIDEETESDEGVTREFDDADLRPRCYDQEFWSPLVENAYGGSNAAEILCGFDDPYEDGKEEQETKVPLTGFRGQSSADGNNRTPSHGQSRENVWTPPRGQGNPASSVKRPVRRRELAEVSDDEFDMPPMFDDTKYDPLEIPDLDVDDDDVSVYVGKAYCSKVDCQISLAIYAIKNRFHFKQVRTKKNYFVLECPDKTCPWRVRANEIGDSGFYEIRAADLVHKCSIETRNSYRQRASSRVIAAVYRSKYGDPLRCPAAGDLQQLVLEDLRVSASYMKCYRAKEIALKGLHGDEDLSYSKLPEYLHMLKLANPGTIADIETEKDEAGMTRFLYLFLSFGASILGFRRLRHVLVIDGTHLGGKYKGVLLTASGQDANFQPFPLAFGIVDSENDDSWTWFLQKVERILADNPRLTIISDRHMSINNAISRVYPQANHGACIVHLMRNVNSRYRSKGLAKLVGKAAFSFTVGGWRMAFEKVKEANLECAKYLHDIGVGHWARSHFPGDRYNLMTSNVAEQLNKALKKARSSPVLELLIFIQRMMTRWFAARRKKSLAYRGIATPEVEKIMNNQMTITKGSRINPLSNWRGEVVGVFGQKNLVFLDQKRCSCVLYQKYKIPCGHALLFADSVGVSYDSLVGDCYKPKTWCETYTSIISPEGNPADVDIPQEIREQMILPPRTRRPSGRPKEGRIPSTGEIPVVRKTKLVPNKCRRCGNTGHNRTTCTVPI